MRNLMISIMMLLSGCASTMMSSSEFLAISQDYKKIVPMCYEQEKALGYRSEECKKADDIMYQAALQFNKTMAWQSSWGSGPTVKTYGTFQKNGDFSSSTFVNGRFTGSTYITAPTKSK